MASLKEQFLSGKVPDNLDLMGEWAVHLVAEYLPPIRFFMHKKVVQRETGGGLAGHNQFLGAIKAGHFKVDRGPSSGNPELEVVRISYDMPKNPGLFRPLTDEVRMIAEDKYLGQGMYKFPGGPRNVFWFTMTRL